MAAAGKPTLLHLNDSQSQTILWLLEELGIDYDLKLFKRVNLRAPPELKETHPIGKAPQLITSTGRVITERSAIALYLLDTYDTAGKFKIASPPVNPEYDAVSEDAIISFGSTNLNSFLMIRLIFSQLVKKTPFFVRPLTSGIKALLDSAFLNTEVDLNMSYLDSRLEGKEYLMGTSQPTRADFVNLWYIESGHQGKLYDVEKYKNVEAWRVRCTARPAWQRGLEKGNGYNLTF